jgi:hypothetical protein
VTLAITHATAADGTFSAEGATAWNEAHALVGAASVAQGGTGSSGPFTVGAILFGNGTSALATDDANLHWDDTDNYLRIGGAPTGWATTDKLQVNGTVLLNTVQIENTSSWISNYKSIRAGQMLQYVTQDASSIVGGINFYPGIPTGVDTFGGAMVFGAGASNGVFSAGNFEAYGGPAYGSGLGGGIIFAAGASTSGTNGNTLFYDANFNSIIEIGSTDNTLGFFAAPPVAQPAAPTTLADVITGLKALGLFAT